MVFFGDIEHIGRQTKPVKTAACANAQKELPFEGFIRFYVGGLPDDMRIDAKIR